MASPGKPLLHARKVLFQSRFFSSQAKISKSGSSLKRFIEVVVSVSFLSLCIKPVGDSAYAQPGSNHHKAWFISWPRDLHGLLLSLRTFRGHFPHRDSRHSDPGIGLFKEAVKRSETYLHSSKTPRRLLWTTPRRILLGYPGALRAKGSAARGGPQGQARARASPFARSCHPEGSQRLV